MNNDIKKYIDEKTEEFKKELNEEVKQMIKEANQGQVKSIWDLKISNGEKYYRLYSDGDIVRVVFYTNYDERARDIGNAFLTKEEAEFMKERRSIEAVMRKYSKPFKFNKHNYCLVYNRYNESVNIESYGVFNCGVSYFETKEIAQQVIDKIGEDRLKKYWFGVKE